MEDEELNLQLGQMAAASFAQMLESAKLIERTGYHVKKEWLSARDRRVRLAHAEANGQIRELEEPFEVGSEKIMFPHDPQGSHENTYLCRCIAVSVIFQKNTNGEWEKLQ